MRILVIGGAGLVGELTLPKLSEKHDVTVFDRQPPSAVDAPYIRGDLRDHRAVRDAVRGMDAVVFMAMGPKDFPDSVDSAIAQFDVAVTGLYGVLRSALDEGVGHAVYASSMSVYDNDWKGHGKLPVESVPANSVYSYGLAKRLGEEVCRAATAHGMSVVALRLCFPTPLEEWPVSEPSALAITATSGPDTAEAFLRALDRRGNGYEEFAISGDTQGRMVDISKARDVLGWRPADPTD